MFEQIKVIFWLFVLIVSNVVGLESRRKADFCNGKRVEILYILYAFVCVRAHLHQVVKRHSVPLGFNADWICQHPHVLPGVAMDACGLPTFLPTCPSACQSRAARGERTPLHNVSKVKMRTIKASFQCSVWKTCSGWASSLCFF